MTPFEVFMTYVKLRGAMPTMHKYAMIPRSIYVFDVNEGRYTRKPCMFKDVFNNHFQNHGFGNTIFVNLLYQYPDGQMAFDDPNVEKAHKRWTSFVSKNVIPDGNIKVGSKVKYKFWGVEHVGTVSFINNDYSRVKIVRNNNEQMPFYDNVSLSSIVECDGNPVDISFHIKWKGKEYGTK